MSDTVGIHIGALSPQIRDQLAGQGLEAIDPDHVARWQEDVDALNRLRIRGVITDADAHRAGQRIIKRISRNVRRAADS